MKITFIMGSGFNLSGGDRVISTYAKHLQQRGHDVLIASRPSRSPSWQEQLRSLVKGRGWIPSPHNQPSHFDNLNLPCHILDEFRPIVDADLPDADVVIATWWETAEWVANLSAAKGAKAYFVQHHEVFDYLPKEKAAASYLLPLHKIVVAQWLVDVMRTHYGDTHVSLVPNGVDTGQFTAPPRGKRPIPTFGVMYSPIVWKGCDISLQAFSLAAQRVPNIQLLAFGKGKPLPHLPLPPGTQYIDTPPQDQLKALYARCDAWLFGSRFEGFGLPIVEAMACRTPVIGTPVGAAPELLAQGAGLLVKPEDPEDMANAIETVCRLSDEEWKHMSDLAYLRASSYTWDEATTLFEAALQTAIERDKRGDFVNYNLAKITNV